MSAYFYAKNSFINYTDEGRGEVLVILHGYLESIEVFKGFSLDLSSSCRVICVDIPGHGLSTVQDNLSMSGMAYLLNEFLNYLGIDKFCILGHSMGGYFALAYVEMYSERVKSIFLLHSSANADGPDKISRRRREIDLINNGKRDFICSYSISSTFYNQNKDFFSLEIKNLIDIAKQTPERGIVSALNCMINRKDYNSMLKKIKINKYLFLGRYDDFIDVEYASACSYCVGMQVFVFDFSGHMSFIEEKEKCLSLLISLCVDEKKQ